MNIEEMRMQIQTQLNPNDVENLFFDASESAEGCDDIQLTLNLRTISAYNFGVLQDRLRGFADHVLKNIQNYSYEHKSFVSNDPMMPKIELVLGSTGEGDLDKEIAELEKDI